MDSQKTEKRALQIHSLKVSSGWNGTTCIQSYLYPQIKIPLLIQLQFCRFPTIPRFLCACKVHMYMFYEVKTEH